MLATLFSFWPAIAAGAIAIPVIIHLINSKRYKIVPWAAMRFLLAAQKQTRKRMRIEQLILLLVRILVIALILFAMISVMSWAEEFWAMTPLARWGPSRPMGQTRTHHIFVLDASLSMNQRAIGDQTAFENAREQMLRKVNSDHSSGDGYSILVLKDSPTWIIGEGAQDQRRVAREIEKLTPSHGNSSVQSALSMISSKLAEQGPRFPRQAVYFFTDMQGTTWGAANKFDGDREKNPYLDIEDKKATTVFVDCGPHANNSNLAVTHVEFDLDRTPYLTTGMDFTLRATVANFGMESKVAKPEILRGKAKEGPNDSPLELRVTAFKPEEQEFEVKSNSSRTFSFHDVRFDKPGTYALQVRIPDDAMMPDNTRTIIVTVRETIPVLLVNGKLSAERFSRATDFLQIALNPFPPGKEERFLPLRPTVVSPQRFKEMTPAELEAFDCIYWCDVPDFNKDGVAKLDAHVRRGGGLIISLGDSATEKLGEYNELFYKDGQGLMPAKLMKRITAPAEHSFYMQNTDLTAFSVPPLAAFSDDRDRHTLRMARFREYVQSEAKEGRARTVLWFATEYNVNDNVKRDDTLPATAPAIIEWNPPISRAQLAAEGRQTKRTDRAPVRARGKVILLTTSVNRDWSNWPGGHSFVAMMHELTKLGISGRLREQSTSVGGGLDGALPGGAELDVTIKFPAGIDLKPGRLKTQSIDDVNVFRWADTDVSGVYRADTSGGHEIPFAVNVPTTAPGQKRSESDLERIDEAKLKEGYPGWTLQIVRDPLDAMLSGAGINTEAIETPLPVGPVLANIALLFVLGLMFLEILLAWLFGHYTTTEGALAQTNPSQTATVIAAVIAGLTVFLVAVGSFVIWHAYRWDDFLGFLPEILRDWFELVMGIQAPDAGEGRSWPLKPQGFLFGLPGSELWYSILITLAAATAIFFTYRAEAPRVSLLFKMLLGALRFCLILTTLWFILPRMQIEYERRGYPDLVILIDDSRSMGEPDTFHDEKVIEKVNKLSAKIEEKVRAEIPDRINAIEAEIRAREAAAEKDADAKADWLAEKKDWQDRLDYWKQQEKNIADGKWRPSRLQLVQAILAQPEPHWLKTLLNKHKTKIHIFHLDVTGKAVKLHDGKGDAGEIIDARNIERASKAIEMLGPVGQDSRLGTAVRQVIDHYKGTGLSSVIMFTDGVTTRDETLSQVADYASQRGVGLFFIGVGDEHPARDLRLHDLSVDDPIYLDDTAVFEFRLTAHGYKDVTLPIILKLKDKDGNWKEVDKTTARVDLSGRSIKLRLKHKPKDLGPHPYRIEVKPPPQEPHEKPLPENDLRIDKVIEVIDMKQIKILYVEGQPRYEFRYLKFLLEREGELRAHKVEGKEQKEKKKGMDLKVLLLDADDDWGINEQGKGVDATALRVFPPTLEELNKYDVIIIGDCDPKHQKLATRLTDIALFVKGEKPGGTKGEKPGGGILFMAGASYNPHRYKGTPLADVMPVEPTQDAPPPEVLHKEPWRPKLTALGKIHPMFRFGPDQNESVNIFDGLQKIYWHTSRYRIKPLAEVLAVHPTEKAQLPLQPGQDPNHPLVVQQFVGTGRSMFFGFDETWRWRFREHESKYNTFWIQSMRYLSRGRLNRTELKLDRQTPYKVGDDIKVTVTFPDSASSGGGKPGPKIDAKTKPEVTVIHLPLDAKEKVGAKLPTMKLDKVKGSFGQFEGTLPKVQEGKYRFRLTDPDVSESQPDKQKPTAEATVELPPGELDKLRMDYQEMEKAAALSNGAFYKLANCDQLLEELPPGGTIPIPLPVPPTLLWNQWWVFVLIVLLITSEWVLRKMKHLL